MAGIVRQRVVDQAASVLDIDYLDKELVPTMTREIAEHSIYHFIENDLGLSIDYAKKEITIDHATSRDKILLDIGERKPCRFRQISGLFSERAAISVHRQQTQTRQISLC